MCMRVFSRYLFGSLLLMSVLLFSVVFSQPVQAQEPSCQCFCATKEGATLYSPAVTPSACELTCKADGYKVAVCAVEAAELPDRNRVCFDKALCDSMGGELGDKQPSECVKGQFYCFPKNNKSAAKLNIQIGDLKTVGDLGTYVQAAYKFMLGAAIVITIVMVMVGGFQYAIGAHASDQIKKGTERMKNSVTGLLLLIGAALIAGTVNPQLLKLELPRLSLIRPLTLGGKTCEQFLEEGFDVKSQEPKNVDLELVLGGKMVALKVPTCGTQAQVSGTGAKGEAVGQGAVCMFSRKCPNPEYECVPIEEGSKQRTCKLKIDFENPKPGAGGL